MKQAKVNYKKKCKSREVDFYLHDQALYNFSKTINFNKFVKDMLKTAMQLGGATIEKWRKDTTKNG